MPTVLVGEESVSLGKLYRLKLEEDGYLVLVARDSDEAYEKFDGDHPDVAVVNFLLPTETGVQLAERLASANPKENTKREEVNDEPIYKNEARESPKEGNNEGAQRRPAHRGGDSEKGIRNLSSSRGRTWASDGRLASG